MAQRYLLSSPHTTFLKNTKQFTNNILQNSCYNHKPCKTITITNALKERREYEQAVKEKDLARALRLLKQTPFEPVETNILPGRDLVGWEKVRDWEVLDTCFNADDMRLVGAAYSFLKDRGFLPSFGKCRNIVLDGPREVTPGYLTSLTGLEGAHAHMRFFSKLDFVMFLNFHRRSGDFQDHLVLYCLLFRGEHYLLNQGIDIRPILAAVLGLAMVDAVFLGGTCLAQLSSYWPPHRRRIFAHEAGHLLVAYLMGCPIRGVILDPIMAMQMGIQGQAGTQFWDENLQTELAQGRLSGTAFDRYCIVLFGGIAAEALVYGEAEGGENDENLFRGISITLDPPLSVAQMANQARWSVLQSYNLLKWHKKAHRAAVKAMENGGSLSFVIRTIEETISSDR